MSILLIESQLFNNFLEKMRNNTRQNNHKDNNNFQDVPQEIDSQKLTPTENVSQDFFTINKGFPHYGKKFYLAPDESWSNYDDDKKNTEQEFVDQGSNSDLSKVESNFEKDYKDTDQKDDVDDADLGQTQIEQNQNRNDNNVDNEKNL